MRSNLVGRFLARSRCAGMLALVMALGAPLGARADVIVIQSNTAASTSGLGMFTGTLNYFFSLVLNSWALKVTLNNTSPAANGGYITAFIFNIGSSDPNASATLNSTTSANFTNLPNANGQPYGNPFRAGAGVDGNFEGGGGSPSQGIPTGGSEMFTFTVSASDAPTLHASSFLEGPYQYNFLVRFRGFEHHGSDKVPAQIVPGPAVLTVMAFGLAFIGGRRRRIR